MKRFRVDPTAEHVLETAELLWPAPAAARLTRADDGVAADAGPATSVREFIFVPSAGRPRLLLPGATPASAAAALRRYSEALGPLERVTRAVGAVAVGTGLTHRLLRDRLRVMVPDGVSTIESELAEILGRPVVVSLGLGNRRANQKPVLQVLSPAGQSLAFVKVGDNAVTRPLVRAEAEALGQLADLGLRSLRIPRVLHLASWRDLELLVLSPLPTTARRRARRGRLPVAAFAELASAAGVEHRSLVGSDYWQRLVAQSELLTPTDASRLRPALDSIAERHGDPVLPFGSWHGDWTPWNMSWEPEGLTVWDWERFATGVPIGFDPLHFQLRLDMDRHGTRADSGRRLRERAPSLLAPLGVPAGAIDSTVCLYLLELCLRFTVAASGPTGEPLRARAQWLQDLVSREIGAH